MPVDAASIARAADVVRQGGAVGFPTETVYGLGVNAFDERAVAKMFELKGRPRFNPVIVHASDLEQVRQIVADFPDQARALADAFWPGPLTLVLPKRPSVPDLVTAGLATVGVRVPAHSAARELIEQAGTAVAAPSANRSGRVSPTTAQHVLAEFGDDLPIILDAGPCVGGVESTVVSLAGSRPVVMRLGGVTVEELGRVVGPADVSAEVPADPDDAERARASPGMLERHYAPRTPLHLVDKLDGLDVPALGRRAGLLTLTDPGSQARAFVSVECLSAAGELREAAANLFAALRRLDDASLDVIVALRVPEHGLGRAINDRLSRASTAEQA